MSARALLDLLTILIAMPVVLYALTVLAALMGAPVG